MMMIYICIMPSYPQPQQPIYVYILMHAWYLLLFMPFIYVFELYYNHAWPV
jgi:hypothetical protein